MTVFLLLLLAASQDTTAIAPRPDPYRPPSATIVAEPVSVMLAGFDRDGDGRVTRAEVEAGVARSFAEADTARQGWIGYIAYSDWAERWLGDRNAVPSPLDMDRDGDNHITAQEMTDRVAAIFDRLDRDHDGTLYHAEMLTIRGSAIGDRPDGRRGRAREGGPERRLR